MSQPQPQPQRFAEFVEHCKSGNLQEVYDALFDPDFDFTTNDHEAFRAVTCPRLIRMFCSRYPLYHRDKSIASVDSKEYKDYKMFVEPFAGCAALAQKAFCKILPSDAFTTDTDTDADVGEII